MSKTYDEKSFEEAIENSLLKEAPVESLYGQKAKQTAFVSGGFSSRRPDEYEKELCLIPTDLLQFIYATQPKEWEKYQKAAGNKAKDSLLQRIKKAVDDHGTLHILRKGIKSLGSHFKLAFYKPVTGMNESLQELYRANIFSVVRQLKYSMKNENSLDMVLFINGLPVFTAELKNHLTGQTVEDAMRQYKKDRDPVEPLFRFGRCLAHFAVDPELVYMTTELKKDATRFLPFNRGDGTGAGNPPSGYNKYATSYLWEEVWSRDGILDLIQNFIQVIDILDEDGRPTGKKAMIFPRYHQLDAVHRLIEDSKTSGTGHSYLVQHSAGSGKSFTIAWLAYHLSNLHVDDRRLFDSVIVVTDRRVLDRQLQNTIGQFEDVKGKLENIDKTSRQLREALENGRDIIVTTLQKFPVIVDQIGELKSDRFAVIIDEAHSSQSGETVRDMNEVLAVETLEEAEIRDGVESEDLEDKITDEMKKRGRLPNVSYFAFTATPKNKTLETFGVKRADGKFEPFSLYSMRQAIEEGFIMDVLENYTTFKTYFRLLKKIEEDPQFEKAKASYLLQKFVRESEYTISKKIEIIIEHFRQFTMDRIKGRAKAMIVTSSRLHAVRYRQAFDRYVKEKGYDMIKALVAFSGTVRDGGIDYTEANMNGFSESQTAGEFNTDKYRFLIVANKFLTGFDQPLLHTMYVDKRLNGVHAVQTLSRLNRIHPDKKDTMILDFVNEVEEIEKSFQPYYEKTLLTEGTDPDTLYDLETVLEQFQLYSQDDVDRFAEVYFSGNSKHSDYYNCLKPVISRFEEVEEDVKLDFRKTLTRFVHLYSFLSRIITFSDPGLEKLYHFARFLLRRLPIPRGQLPLEVLEDIDMESLRIQKTSKGKIQLERGPGELKPTNGSAETGTFVSEQELLSKIIEDLNERFGTEFTEEDKVFLSQLQERLEKNEALRNSVQVNPPSSARLTFDNIANDIIQDMIDSNIKFYKKINDDQDFASTLLDFLFDRYLKSKKETVSDPTSEKQDH